MTVNGGKFNTLSGKFKKHLAALKSCLKKQASCFENEIRKEAADCVRPEGKYLRSLLLFSCAPSLKPSDKALINRACVVELIHLASLIHDDVIDNANLRRNNETALKKYGVRTAILLGDAIFSHAMILAYNEGSNDVIKGAIHAVKALCEGEVRQSLASKKGSDFKKYMSIIESKTASLFDFACFLGANIENPKDKAWIMAAQKAGKHLGIAYQIYDDIADWTLSEKESGKTAGTDFIFEKYTLPIIKLLQELPAAEAKALEKNLHGYPLEKLRSLMLGSNAISESAKIYEKQIELARNAVAKFPKKNKCLLEFCDEMSALISK